MTNNETRKIIKRIFHKELIKVILKQYTAIYIVKSFIAHSLYDYPLLFIMIVALI